MGLLNTGVSTALLCSLSLEFSVIVWEIFILYYASSPVIKGIWYTEGFQSFEEMILGILLFTFLTSVYWTWYFWQGRRPLNKYIINFRKGVGATLAIGAGVLIINAILVLANHCWNKQESCLGKSYDVEIVGAGFLMHFFILLDAGAHFLPPCTLAPIITYPPVTLPPAEKEPQSEKPVVIVDTFRNVLPVYSNAPASYF